MQPWITAPTFDAKPNTEVFAPAEGWSKAASPVSPWTVSASPKVVPEAQAYQTDENLKKQFGIELAKAANPFEAGCKVFGEETSKALWASFNWLTDPIVVASRDIYLKTVELSQPPLDKEQLAAKVLALAEGEKVERNGVKLPTIEAKDRIAAYKLYSEILGYTGKVEIDASTKNFTHNEMIIKLVKAEDKKVTVIDQAPKNEIKNEISNSPITLKLVGGVRA